MPKSEKSKSLRRVSDPSAGSSPATPIKSEGEGLWVKSGLNELKLKNLVSSLRGEHDAFAKGSVNST